MIPPFHSAVDKAIAYLDPVDGLLGVADFFVSGKHDLPMRQMNPLRRFFWRYVEVIFSCSYNKASNANTFQGLAGSGRRCPLLSGFLALRDFSTDDRKHKIEWLSNFSNIHFCVNLDGGLDLGLSNLSWDANIFRPHKVMSLPSLSEQCAAEVSSTRITLISDRRGAITWTIAYHAYGK